MGEPHDKDPLSEGAAKGRAQSYSQIDFQSSPPRDGLPNSPDVRRREFDVVPPIPRRKYPKELTTADSGPSITHHDDEVPPRVELGANGRAYPGPPPLRRSESLTRNDQPLQQAPAIPQSPAGDLDDGSHQRSKSLSTSPKLAGRPPSASDRVGQLTADGRIRTPTRPSSRERGQLFPLVARSGSVTGMSTPEARYAVLPTIGDTNSPLASTVPDLTKLDPSLSIQRSPDNDAPRPRAGWATPQQRDRSNSGPTSPPLFEEGDDLNDSADSFASEGFAFQDGGLRGGKKSSPNTALQRLSALPGLSGAPGYASATRTDYPGTPDGASRRGHLRTRSDGMGQTPVGAPSMFGGTRRVALGATPTPPGRDGETEGGRPRVGSTGSNGSDGVDNRPRLRSKEGRIDESPRGDRNYDAGDGRDRQASYSSERERRRAEGERGTTPTGDGRADRPTSRGKSRPGLPELDVDVRTGKDRRLAQTLSHMPPLERDNSDSLFLDNPAHRRLVHRASSEQQSLRVDPALDFSKAGLKRASTFQTGTPTSKAREQELMPQVEDEPLSDRPVGLPPTPEARSRHRRNVSDLTEYSEDGRTPRPRGRSPRREEEDEEEVRRRAHGRDRREEDDRRPPTRDEDRRRGRSEKGGGDRDQEDTGMSSRRNSDLRSRDRFKGRDSKRGNDGVPSTPSGSRSKDHSREPSRRDDRDDRGNDDVPSTPSGSRSKDHSREPSRRDDRDDRGNDGVPSTPSGSRSKDHSREPTRRDDREDRDQAGDEVQSRSRRNSHTDRNRREGRDGAERDRERTDRDRDRDRSEHRDRDRDRSENRDRDRDRDRSSDHKDRDRDRSDRDRDRDRSEHRDRGREHRSPHGDREHSYVVYRTVDRRERRGSSINPDGSTASMGGHRRTGSGGGEERDREIADLRAASMPAFASLPQRGRASTEADAPGFVRPHDGIESAPRPRRSQKGDGGTPDVSPANSNGMLPMPTVDVAPPKLLRERSGTLPALVPPSRGSEDSSQGSDTTKRRSNTKSLDSPEQRERERAAAELLARRSARSPREGSPRTISLRETDNTPRRRHGHKRTFSDGKMPDPTEHTQRSPTGRGGERALEPDSPGCSSGSASPPSTVAPILHNPPLYRGDMSLSDVEIAPPVIYRRPSLKNQEDALPRTGRRGSIDNDRDVPPSRKPPYMRVGSDVSDKDIVAPQGRRPSITEVSGAKPPLARGESNVSDRDLKDLPPGLPRGRRGSISREGGDASLHTPTQGHSRPSSAGTKAIRLEGSGTLENSNSDNNIDGVATSEQRLRSPRIHYPSIGNSPNPGRASPAAGEDPLSPRSPRDTENHPSPLPKDNPLSPRMHSPRLTIDIERVKRMNDLGARANSPTVSVSEEGRTSHEVLVGSPPSPGVKVRSPAVALTHSPSGSSGSLPGSTVDMSIDNSVTMPLMPLVPKERPPPRREQTTMGLGATPSAHRNIAINVVSASDPALAVEAATPTSPSMPIYPKPLPATASNVASLPTPTTTITPESPPKNPYQPPVLPPSGVTVITTEQPNTSPPNTSPSGSASSPSSATNAPTNPVVWQHPVPFRPPRSSAAPDTFVGRTPTPKAGAAPVQHSSSADRLSEPGRQRSFSGSTDGGAAAEEQDLHESQDELRALREKVRTIEDSAVLPQFDDNEQNLFRQMLSASISQAPAGLVPETPPDPARAKMVRRDSERALAVAAYERANEFIRSAFMAATQLANQPGGSGLPSTPLPADGQEEIFHADARRQRRRASRTDTADDAAAATAAASAAVSAATTVALDSVGSGGSVRITSGTTSPKDLAITESQPRVNLRERRLRRQLRHEKRRLSGAGSQDDSMSEGSDNEDDDFDDEQPIAPIAELQPAPVDDDALRSARSHRCKSPPVRSVTSIREESMAMLDTLAEKVPKPHGQAAPTPKDENLRLMYDSHLKLYFDPETNDYYELADI